MGQQLGGGRNKGGRVYGCVRPPGLVQVEDQGETRHQGWREGSLRQGGDGEGEACTEDCEGLPSGRPEEQHLSRYCYCSSTRSVPDFMSLKLPSCTASRGRSAE